MQGKSEPGSGTALPESALSLGLVLKRQGETSGQRALLAVLPFLALGGRWPSRVQGAVRGWGGQQTLPWLAPRWFGWGGRAVLPADPGEPETGRSHDAAHSEPSAELQRSPDQPLAPLGAMAPALCWMGRELGAATHAQPPAMRSLIWQPLAGLAPAQGRPSPSGSGRAGTAAATARASASSPNLNRGSENPLSTAGGRPMPTLASRSGAGMSAHPSLPGTSTSITPESEIQRQPARAPEPASIVTLVGRSLAEKMGPWPHPAPGAPDTAGSPKPHLRAAAPAWGLLSILPGFAVRSDHAGSSGIGTQRPTPGRTAAAPIRGLPTMLPGLAIGAVPARPVGVETARPIPLQSPSPEMVSTLPRGHVPSELPGPGGQQDKAPARWALPAQSSPAERKGPGPGPYAANPLQTLQVVAGNVERLVERQVAQAVRQQREEMQAASQGPDAVRDPVTATNLASDEVARLLLQKMQGLAREERFRRGQLG